MSLQEKFQITLPPTSDDTPGWTDFNSVRRVGAPGMLHVNNRGAEDAPMVKFNMPPPGMDISNQLRARINNMPLVVSGQNDVSGDVNPEAFAKGFTRRAMNGADDQYSGEHVDHFYGEAVDEKGNVGFCERNNMLDRM